jgi:hypothetical protein
MLDRDARWPLASAHVVFALAPRNGVGASGKRAFSCQPVNRCSAGVVHGGRVVPADRAGRVHLAIG